MQIILSPIVHILVLCGIWFILSRSRSGRLLYLSLKERPFTLHVVRVEIRAYYGRIDICKIVYFPRVTIWTFSYNDIYLRHFFTIRLCVNIHNDTMRMENSLLTQFYLGRFNLYFLDSLYIVFLYSVASNTTTASYHTIITLRDLAQLGHHSRSASPPSRLTHCLAICWTRRPSPHPLHG